MTNKAIISESSKARALLKECMVLLETHKIASHMRIAAELNNQLVSIVLQKKRSMKYGTLEQACAGILPEGVPHRFSKPEVLDATGARRAMVPRCGG